MRLLESGGNGAKLFATFENGLAYEVAKIISKKAFKSYYQKLLKCSKIMPKHVGQVTFALAYEVAKIIKRLSSLF